MTFTNQTKNIIAYIRSLITTDDDSRILVGSSEDEVLIWTAETTGFTNQTKN